MTLALLAAGFMFPSAVLGGGQGTAAAFLKVPVSAQSMGLGGNAVVSGSGMSGALENPGLLGLITEDEFHSSYGSYFEGYNIISAGYGLQGRAFNGGVSFTRMAADDFEGRDAQGAPTGGFGASDMAVSVSAGKGFEWFAGGVTVKYISSRIESESASALAADVGAVFFNDRYSAHPYKVGISVRNIGGGMKYQSKKEPLPLSASAGLALEVGGGMELVFNLSHNIAESRLEAGAGLGLNVGGGFNLNGGVTRAMGVSEGGVGGLPVGVNAGVGLKLSGFMLDYGFRPLGELGNVQSMSLTFKFGGKGGEWRMW